MENLPDNAENEAERKRRMAKLRRDSAKRTLEITERKFPTLKRPPSNFIPLEA